MITLLYSTLTAPVEFQSCAGMWPTQYNLTHITLDKLLQVYENAINRHGPDSTAVSLQFTEFLNGTWDVIMWKTSKECVYSFNLLCIDYIELENEQWKLFACMQTIDKEGDVCPGAYNNIHKGNGILDVTYRNGDSTTHYEYIKDIKKIQYETANSIGLNKTNVFFRNHMCGEYSDTFYSDEQFSYHFEHNSNLDIWTRYCPLNIVYDIT